MIFGYIEVCGSEILLTEDCLEMVVIFGVDDDRAVVLAAVYVDTGSDEHGDVHDEFFDDGLRSYRTKSRNRGLSN